MQDVELLKEKPKLHMIVMQGVELLKEKPKLHLIVMQDVKLLKEKPKLHLIVMQDVELLKEKPKLHLIVMQDVELLKDKPKLHLIVMQGVELLKEKPKLHLIVMKDKVAYNGKSSADNLRQAIKDVSATEITQKCSESLASSMQEVRVNKELYIYIYMIYLTTHSTHFIYGYMASGIW